MIIGLFSPLSLQYLPFRLGSINPLRCSQTIMPTAKAMGAAVPIPEDVHEQ